MKPKLSPAVQIAILIAFFATMASDMVIVPILDSILASFPDSSMTVVGLCHNAAGFAFIPASFLTTFLCRKYDKRPLMLIGGLMCMLGGGLSALIHNLAYMIAMYFIEGLGAGMCTVLIAAYIAELAADERDMLRMNSLNGVVGCCMAFICSTATGLIATRFGWQYSYCIFFLAGLFLVWQWRFLPSTPPERGGGGSVSMRVSVRVWRLARLHRLEGCFLCPQLKPLRQ